MRPMKFGQFVGTTVLCSAAFLVLSDPGLRRGSEVMAAQRSPAMNSGRPIDPPSSGVPPVIEPQMSDSTDAHAADRDRHKEIAADVDRLVLLSSQLKADVDKTANDQMSLDVIKKAREIEKLAHAVQGRMKS